VLGDLVRDAARRVPDQPAVIQGDQVTTYADLADRAAQFAAGLTAQGISRFAVSLPSVADLVAILAGASLVGAEPCIYPACATEDLVAELSERFDHSAIVTDPSSLLGSSTELPDGEVTSAPILILTTGTTGRRKGAQHDWARLIRGVRKHDVEPGARWLLAYNTHQFAGIQVLLHVLVHAATLVVPEANQPAVALGAMRTHGVTHASATPTFWRFLSALLDDKMAAELPLEQITLGGEPIPAALLETLAKLFPKAKVSQVYASTEFGSSVSVRDAANGLPATVLDRGDDADVQLRVVDGELHARSRVGMLGYYGDSAEEAGWRPTGDLVEVRDGRIYFVGRTSDIINVGGVKVHPLPIEEAVCGVPGVELARAYGRENPLTGQIVALDVVALDGYDTDDLEDAIREACEQLPAAHRPRRIRFVDAIDVQDTKIVRRA
jgi:acyl-coenzyme A synthetase/AMP-(fatty) acid ligase